MTDKSRVSWAIEDVLIAKVRAYASFNKCSTSKAANELINQSTQNITVTVGANNHD